MINHQFFELYSFEKCLTGSHGSKYNLKLFFSKISFFVSSLLYKSDNNHFSDLYDNFQSVNHFSKFIQFNT